MKIVLSVYFQLRLISVLGHVTVGVSDLMFLNEYMKTIIAKLSADI